MTVSPGIGLASSREPLRDRAGPTPQGRQGLQHRRQPRQRALQVQEGRRRLDPRDDGRRPHRGLRGVSRHPQRRPRALEGGHPLPPGRHPRRGAGAVDLDDVEVLADGNPFRRCQGWRHLRPEEAFRAGARGHDPPLHVRDHQRDRAGEGHPGSGRRHEPARDGLDIRHLLDEQGPLRARRRDRQAADRRRVAGPAGGDRAGRRVLHARGARPPRDAARRQDGRRPGLRQRRQLLRLVHAAGGREGDRDLRLGRRLPQRERDRRRLGDRAQAGARDTEGSRRGGGDLERRAPRCSTATSSPRAGWSR